MSVTDIVTSEQLADWLGDEGRGPATLVGLDLIDGAPNVGDVDVAGCLFVGCLIDDTLAARLVRGGATVLGQVSDLPIPVARRTLYSVADLYRGFDPAEPGSWKRTPDHEGWNWFIDPRTELPRPLDTGQLLAARVHDSTTESALRRVLASARRPVVGVMGGHDEPRTSTQYVAIAEFAREVTRRGRLVLTGGGPGLMEAANLGAFLSAFPDDALDAALGTLESATDFRSHDWLRSAAEVRERLLGRWDAVGHPDSMSIGVPTWLYGHEPPNMFATHSAKLFFNAIREDGLVTVADAGILFAKGNAGTVQEIFQDATQNYYRETRTTNPPPTPMVLFGESYWDRPPDEPPVADPTSGKVTDKRKPLLPLLRQLAAEKNFGGAVVATSDLGVALHHLAPKPVEPVEPVELVDGRGLAWRQQQR